MRRKISLGILTLFFALCLAAMGQTPANQSQTTGCYDAKGNYLCRHITMPIPIPDGKYGEAPAQATVRMAYWNADLKMLIKPPCNVPHLGECDGLASVILDAVAQTPAPTGDPVLDALAKYQADAGADGGNLIATLLAWKAAREKAESDLQKATAGLVQDEANIKTLQGQVAALMNPAPAPPVSPLLYMLAVSPNVNYSGSTPLDSGTVKGNVYIFTAPFNNPGNPNPTGVAMVSYTLDAIACPNVERNSPYDFMGGGAAGFWNTTLDCLGKPIANGKHIITQVVTFTSGGTETDRAAFTVAN